MEKNGSLLVSKILCAFFFFTLAFSVNAQESATEKKEERRIIKGQGSR